MILNDLIRDCTISPNCRWMLIYLLSNDKGWTIRVPQIINHVKGFIGKNSVHGMIKEAIESGYMMKEEYTEKNLKRTRYYVSEAPKFKKFLRRPECRDPEAGDAENRDCKEGTSSKKKISKKIIIADPTPMAKTSKPPKPESMPAGGNNNSFVCLASCSDLSEAQKRQLSKYPESVVADAVRYCYHASVKLEGPQARIKQLHAFCKNPSAYSDTLKDLDSPTQGKSLKDQILSVCKKGQVYNSHEFDYDDNCLMFIDAAHNHVYSLKWTETDLKRKWYELLKKLGLVK